jgi:hypothetical protein
MIEIVSEIDTKDNAFSLSPEGGLNFIEQLQKLSLKECSNIDRTPYLTGVNNEQKTATLIKTTCKLWSCEACALRNARRWIARIIHGANILDGDWSFATITAHRKSRGLASVANLRKGWKKLINRISYEAKQENFPLHYARVWEQHEDGSFHLHVLFSVNYGTKWLKDNAAECGLGYQAKWLKVDNVGKIAGYVAKYSLKNASVARGGIEWPVGLRRIECSRNWPELPEIKTDEEIAWIVNQTREGQLNNAAWLKQRGLHVIDLVKK